MTTVRGDAEAQALELRREKYQGGSGVINALGRANSR